MAFSCGLVPKRVNGGNGRKKGLLFFVRAHSPAELTHTKFSIYIENVLHT